MENKAGPGEETEIVFFFFFKLAGDTKQEQTAKSGELDQNSKQS